MNWETIVAAALPFILGGGSVFLRANRLRALLKDDVAILTELPDGSAVRPGVTAAAEIGAARLASYTLVPTPVGVYFSAFGLSIVGMAIFYVRANVGQDLSTGDGWTAIAGLLYISGILLYAKMSSYISSLRKRTVRASLAGRKSATYRLDPLAYRTRKLIYRGVVPLKPRPDDRLLR